MLSQNVTAYDKKRTKEETLLAERSYGTASKVLNRTALIPQQPHSLLALFGSLMRFVSPHLNDALNKWAEHPDLREKACAHNLAFDERLTDARGVFFEATAVAASTSWAQLRRRMIDYYRYYVRVSRGIPHSFLSLNAVASIKTIAPELRLIRIEDLRDALELTGISPAQLADALSTMTRVSRALLESFVNDWNTRPDILRNPCSFSARKDECLEELSMSNWPDLLRDKLGLAHFDAGGARIPVALMEFEAREIMDQVAAMPDIAHPFCIPTLLDGGPNPQFFPTPTTPRPGRPGSLDFGCPLGLCVRLSPDELIAEVIHPRLTYTVGHLAAIGFVSTGLPKVDFREMRNAHLWALRIEADRENYGAEL